MRPALTQSSPAFAIPAAFGAAAVAVGARVASTESANDATSAPANFFFNIKTLL
jgi:hypothetical protein